MSLEIIVEALWSLPLASIRGQYPIYFNYTTDLLRTIFIKHNIVFDDVEKLINDAANSLYFIENDHVFILDKAFVPVWNSFSPAIIIACQQILVAEKMVETEEHSANAYFPWLRRAISSKLGVDSSTPFDYDNFEKVWKKLTKEVVLAGGNPKLLNLEFGKIKGANQTKRFPLSQALLSKEDCLRLIESIGREKINRIRRDQLFQEIMQGKRYLTTRGRKVLSLTWMHERIVTQIMAYAASEDVFLRYKNDVQQTVVETSNYIVKAFNDLTGDWLANQMTIGVFDSNTDERILDAVISNKVLQEKIFEPGYAFLPYSSANDCWAIIKQKTELSYDSKIMVCFEEKGEQVVNLLIQQCFGGVEGEIKKNKIPKYKNLSYFFFEPKSLDKASVISNGKVLINSQAVKKEKVFFEGGLAVDSSRSVYSASNLPTAVIHNGIRKALTGPMTVNGHKVTYEFLKNELAEIKTQTKLSVELPEGVKFDFNVVGVLDSLNRIGFPIIDGEVFPVAELSKAENKLVYLDESIPVNLLNDPVRLYKKILEFKKNRSMEKLSDLINSSFRECEVSSEF